MKTVAPGNGSKAFVSTAPPMWLHVGSGARRSFLVLAGAWRGTGIAPGAAAAVTAGANAASINTE